MYEKIRSKISVDYLGLIIYSKTAKVLELRPDDAACSPLLLCHAAILFRDTSRISDDLLTFSNYSYLYLRYIQVSPHTRQADLAYSAYLAVVPHVDLTVCTYAISFLCLLTWLVARKMETAHFSGSFTLTCAALKLKIASTAEAFQLSQCHESGRAPVMFWCSSWDPPFNSCQSRLLEVYISTSWHVLEKTHCCGNVLLTKTDAKDQHLESWKVLRNNALHTLHHYIKCCSAACRTS